MKYVPAEMIILNVQEIEVMCSCVAGDDNPFIDTEMC